MTVVSTVYLLVYKVEEKTSRHNIGFPEKRCSHTFRKYSRKPLRGSSFVESEQLFKKNLDFTARLPRTCEKFASV